MLFARQCHDISNLLINFAAMKRFGLILILLLAVTLPLRAQTAIDEPELPSMLQKTFAGYYHFIEAETGDTLMMLVFNPITVFPRERFKNKKDEEFYWKTVRDVKRTLPYAKLISSTLLETYEYLDTYKSEKQKQAYLEKFEKEIFNQYKPTMRPSRLTTVCIIDKYGVLIGLVGFYDCKISYYLPKRQCFLANKFLKIFFGKLFE